MMKGVVVRGLGWALSCVGDVEGGVDGEGGGRREGVTPGAPLVLSSCTGWMGLGELSGTNEIVMRVVKDKHN